MEEVFALRLVERFEPLAVVGEGDRVNDAVDRLVTGGADLGGEQFGGTLGFDVANEDRLAGERGLKRGFAGGRTHAVEIGGALLFQSLGGEPRDALFVGDAEDHEGLASEIKEVGHGEEMNLESWKSENGGNCLV